MTGRQLGELLWRRRTAVFLFAAPTLAIALAHALLVGETYASRATIVVDSTEPDRDLRYAYYAQQLTPDTFNPYAAFFAARARDGLDTSGARGAASGEVRSSTVVGTEAITVEVVGLSSDPGYATALAEGASGAFIASVARPAEPPADDAPAVRVRLVGPPDAPSVPTSDRRLDVLVALAAATTTGLAGALAVQVGADRRARPGRAT